MDLVEASQYVKECGLSLGEARDLITHAHIHDGLVDINLKVPVGIALDMLLDVVDTLIREHGEDHDLATGGLQSLKTAWAIAGVCL